MTLSEKQQGHLMMLVVIIIFATNIPVSKFILSGHISGLGLTGMRVLFGAIAFWTVSLFKKKEKVEMKDQLILVVGGLTGIIFNQGLFIIGLNETSPVDASIITTSSPLFAMIFAAFLLKEPITLKKAGGVLLGVLGAVILVYSTMHMHQTGQESSTIGNLIVVGSSMSYAFYLVVTRGISSKYSSITIMKWMFTYASIILIPFVYKDMVEAPLFYEANHTALLALLYPLVLATLVAYLLIPMVQRRIRPTTISMYNNLQPVIASTIAIVMGMDQFSIEKLFAAMLVFLGVYLVTQSKSRKDVEREKA